MKPNHLLRNLEDLSREVDTARREYERARVEAARALERAFCDATSEDVQALMKAARRESAALDEFMRLLRVLHELVVQRGTPEPE